MSLRTRIRCFLVLAVLAAEILVNASILPLYWNSMRDSDAETTSRLAEQSVTSVVQSTDGLRIDPTSPESSLAAQVRSSQLAWLSVVQVARVSRDGAIEWSSVKSAGDPQLIPNECRAKLFPGVTPNSGNESFAYTDCSRHRIWSQRFRWPDHAEDLFVALVIDDSVVKHTFKLFLLPDLAVCSILLVVAWMLSGRLTRLVQRPVAEAADVASRLAAGEHAARISVAGHDELAVLATRFNEMADALTGTIDRLTTMEANQRRFVSDVAHEMRTPSATLLAASAGLENPSTRDEAAALVAPQLRRLTSLTEDLLEISRIDDGRALLHLDEVDLDALVRAEIAASPLPDDTHVTGSAGMVVCDAPRVALVVRNLLNNAAQHGGAPVVVSLERTDSAVTVDVRDAGPGVPEALRGTVFDRFVRGDASRHGGSSGLGLSLARENARLHGGELELASDGRTFRLCLPTVIAQPPR